MQIYRLIIVLIAFISFNTASAQDNTQDKYPFSSEPNKFIRDITNLVQSKKQSEYSDIAEVFEFFWANDSINEATKKGFIHLIKTVHDKNLPVIPYYTRNMELIRLINSTTNINQKDMDSLFSTTEKVLMYHPRIEINSYYNILITFFSQDALYKTNNSSFYNNGGLLKIRYVNAPTVSYEETPTETQTNNDLGSFDDWGSGEDSDWGTVDESDDWGSDDWGNDSNSWGTEETKKEDATNDKEEVNEDAILAGFQGEPAPPIEGPVIEYEGASFNWVTRFDTLSIKNANATLLLTDGTLIGEGGTVDWTSAGLDSSVFVELDKYNFNINKTGFSAENVKLNYPEKLEAPIDGTFEFQSSPHKTKAEAEFPRFMSYKSNINIKDLGEDIKYRGGFSLRGHKIYSSSVLGGACLLEVYYEGVKRFKARAKFFVMEDSMITANSVITSVYFGKDSLYHPGTRLNYNRNNKLLRLYKNDGGFKNAAFEDSYHHLEILVDALYWTLGDSTISMTMLTAKTESAAYFESFDNYQLKKYAQLKGLYRFHSLQMVVYYSEKKNKTSFYVDDLAKSYKNIPTENIRSSMRGLMLYGYIDYNPKTGFISLKDKATHYVESRRQEKDYDNITFESIAPPEYNAYLNLKNNDLRVTGVDAIPISDSLDVTFYPKNREVIIKEGRNMVFDGLVTTNSYLFNGRDFTFNYENFDVDLKNIDSLKFEVDIKDTTTGKSLGKKQLNNQLKYTSGLLTIDEPNNKATRKRNPRYPHFDAVAGAYVYFSGKDILNGAYDSTLYYKIPPFDMDSLSGDIESLGFEGTFHSPAFPTFEQKLKVMPDHTFGFEHSAPEEGYQLYRGKATFFGDLHLDAGGLRGDGRIEFYNTTLYSNDFVFYLDSVKTIGTKCFTREGTHPDLSENVVFPKQFVDTYDLNWQVSKDSMNISNLEHNFKIFRDSIDFTGTISLTTNQGMLGNGVVKPPLSQIISTHIVFNQFGLESDYSQFEIVYDAKQLPAVKSDFVKVKLDLNERKAWFNPQEEGIASNSFPLLEYKTSINDGVWDMDEKTVVFSKPEEADIKKSYFYSTNKTQDSLVFSAEDAIYYIDSMRLDISGVPYIKVADGKVIPGDHFLHIHPNAKIDTLYNSEVILDTVNEYHHFYRGKIKIFSRKKFNGEAEYSYVNVEKDTMWIKFSSFALHDFNEGQKKQRDIHSITKAFVLEEDSLKISDHILYKGHVELYGHQEGLYMDGFVKLNLHGHIQSNLWLKNLSEKGLKHEVVIDLTKQKDSLYNGIILTGGKKLQSLFLSKPPTGNHEKLFTAGGVIFFNEEHNEFEVSTLAHLRGESMSENIFAYNEEEEEFRFEGRFNLLTPLEKPNVRMKFAGIGTNKLDSNSFHIKGLAKLYMEMPSQCYEMFGKNIADYALVTGQKGAALAVSDTLYQEVAYLAGDKAGKAFSSMGGHSSLVNVDKFFTEGIIFNKLEMKWNPYNNAWYSVGKLGISNIASFDVNANLKGYLEIKKSSRGDEVNFFIEINENMWYYFSFKNNVLLVAATSYDFIGYLDSKSEAEKNQFKDDYYFASTNPAAKEGFINYFKETYLNGPITGPANAVPSLDEGYGDLYDSGDIDMELQEDNYEEKMPLDEAPTEKEPTYEEDMNLGEDDDLGLADDNFKEDSEEDSKKDKKKKKTK